MKAVILAGDLRLGIYKKPASNPSRRSNIGGKPIFWDIMKMNSNAGKTVSKTRQLQQGT